MKLQYVLGVWLVALFCSACSAQPEPPPFNYEKAEALTPKRRAQMDVAFFNDLVYRNSSTRNRRDSQPRGERIHALAEEGFELAYLAEQMFNFHYFGSKRENADLRRWWARVQQLAAEGDASALCFILVMEPAVLDKHSEVLTATQLAAMERAAMQGHPQCMGEWSGGHWAGRQNNDLVQIAAWNLKGAEKGCLRCQSRMASYFADGEGVPKDHSKAWCWITEAVRQTDSSKVDISTVIGSISSIMDRIDRTDPENWVCCEERPRLKVLYKPGTNCQVVQQLNAPLEPELDAIRSLVDPEGEALYQQQLQRLRELNKERNSP